MNIALIAHDAKKELMVQFCIAYCGILSRHNLCATGTTGKLVSEATGLKITCFMAGSQGGDQQISSRISCTASSVAMSPSTVRMGSVGDRRRMVKTMNTTPSTTGSSIRRRFPMNLAICHILSFFLKCGESRSSLRMERCVRF